MKEFQIRFEASQLEDLRRRISSTRPPRPFPGSGWDFGTDADWLSSLLKRWREDYDWSVREKALNQYPQFTCELDGINIHFFHIDITQNSDCEGSIPALN